MQRSRNDPTWLVTRRESVWTGIVSGSIVSCGVVQIYIYIHTHIHTKYVAKVIGAEWKPIMRTSSRGDRWSSARSSTLLAPRGSNQLEPSGESINDISTKIFFNKRAGSPCEPSLCGRPSWQRRRSVRQKETFQFPLQAVTPVPGSGLKWQKRGLVYLSKGIS